METVVLVDYAAVVEVFGNEDKRYYCASEEQAREIAEFEKSSGNTVVVYYYCGQGLLVPTEE